MRHRLDGPDGEYMIVEGMNEELVKDLKAVCGLDPMLMLFHLVKAEFILSKGKFPEKIKIVEWGNIQELKDYE